MGHIQWRIPKRRKGRHMKMMATKYEPEFLEALHQYAAHETERVGEPVSLATILTTLALKSDARLRRIYDRLKST